MKIESNAIIARDDDALAARGTGTFEEIPAQLVFRSIGYTGQPVAGIPFDERRGLIRNDGGRVIDGGGTHQLGEYVSGWIKRGPSGVIGTNKKDSQDTVGKILEDATAGRLNDPVSDDIQSMIATHCTYAVTWESWQAIRCDRDRGRRGVDARTTAGQANRVSRAPRGSQRGTGGPRSALTTRTPQWATCS